ncbi:zinc-dependent metalloprotease [Kitasatospora sp. NBC_01287]|uniref:zinc-dependent metalloprotease n=1 Tax=Kitasatospora sp. NBC_01287 TaxID=2903573 RepID=UPI00224C968D|nr:zinc-dependent metalloprotease [Kitasatospora sp. NBC_01287]MCX4747382.1 zinc-dependent metalloprotease [Kitasatospora sp. NBC_01287]
MTSASGGADMVDWNLAVATATRLARPGPQVTRDEARTVVAELRRHALAAEDAVRGFTGMRASRLAADGAAPVLVVDRVGWVRANVAGFRTVIRPLTEKLAAKRAETPGGAVLGAVGEKLTGVEVGAVLALLSGKVLGQYETFAAGGDPLPDAAPDSPAELFDRPRTGGPRQPVQGRLLLVAPNIVQVERELDVDPHDFRLWVCLHEETHRTQFSAVPWLRDHVQSEVQAFLAETDVEPVALLERLREALAPGERSATSRTGGGGTLLDVVQTPGQREILARLTAVMSLLEGHADVVMDGVGPSVVPSVAEIREKFQRRRDRGASRLDLVLRRLLGMDAKLRQYQDGAVFVRGVLDRIGMDGFNRVWTSPNTLPTKEEIHDPAAWVARVGRQSQPKPPDE